ncbi:MAG: tetratricopeptide repeat protein [Syntrophomonadaceae bacterium]
MDKKKIIGIAAILAVVLALSIGTFLWSRGSADRELEKLDLAVKYLSENDYEKAILAFNEAIKIDPKEVKAYQGLARVYTLQGRYDEAKAAYDRGLSAVEQDKQPALRLGLAGMYVDNNKLSQAEKAFQELKNANKNCLEAYWGLAIVYQQQGDNAKAEAILRHAVEQNPNEYRAYNTLALFLMQNRKPAAAYNNLVKSLTLEINQQEAYLVLSELYKVPWGDMESKPEPVSNQQVADMLEFHSYYTSEDYQKAVSSYTTKVGQNAGNQKGKILAAIAMIKTGDKSAAENLVKQLVGEKLNDWLLSDLARYYQIAGDNEKAKAAALKALQANGTDLEAIALLQNLNTGQEKIYAAQYLLYNWKPVVKVKEELRLKSLPIPGNEVQPKAPEKESNLLSLEYFVPNVNEQFTYRYTGDVAYDQIITNNKPEHSELQYSVAWTKVGSNAFKMKIVSNKGSEEYSYSVDGNALTALDDFEQLRFASPGEVWNRTFVSKTKEKYQVNYRFVGFTDMVVLGQTMKAAHLSYKWMIPQSSFGGEGESWYVKGLGLVKETAKDIGDDYTTTSTRELVSHSMVNATSQQQGISKDEAIGLVKKYIQDVEKQPVDYHYYCEEQGNNSYLVGQYENYVNGNYYGLTARYLVDKTNGKVSRDS